MNKMYPQNTFDTNYGFVELNRTFHELLEDNSSEGEEMIFGRPFGVKSLGWPDLIQEFRLIILSEAGSGKTAEIRNIGHKLREEGRSAFFLRLEYVSNDFEDAFEVGTYKAFEEWLASGDKGWILLDSVDEARLRNPRDFERAIRKLGRRIETALDRTHIVITGRTTAWRPKTDVIICVNHLPRNPTTTSEVSTQTKEDTINGIQEFTTQEQSGTKSIFKIVAFDELTRDQVAVFATARRIEDTRAFLDAIERADAWSFTTRPQDLEELIGYWLDKGQIGSRLELMQNSISRRLSERDQSREDARPLTVERARLGARLLAATTTLVQDPTIRVPDGAENAKGIDVQSVLPDWDAQEQSVLLSRPVFDEAIYGTVRFHHRSVREYLTAEWFSELLKRETSRRKIEGLFFRNQYGLDIVVPTLRPILPWLVILDNKTMERVLRVAPEIIFEGGDPSQLPIDFRRQVLQEVCEQIAKGIRNHSAQNYAAVLRFATLDLTNDVRKLLQKYTDNNELTAFLLRMVWLGQLKDALPEALRVALNPSADHYARLSAFRAVKAIGSENDLEQIRKSFLADAPELDRELLGELIEGADPTEQTLLWLFACLEKSSPKAPYGYDQLNSSVMEYVNAANIEMLPQILAGLIRFLNIPPMVEFWPSNISEKYQWLIAPVCKATERLIMNRHQAVLKPSTLEILHIVAMLRWFPSHELRDVGTEFSKLVPAWKELNQALFWFEVKKSREAYKHKSGERLTDFWNALRFNKIPRFDESDFEYFAGEISNQEFLDNKLVALSLAFDLYKKANRPREQRMKLKKLVKGNSELTEKLTTYLNPPAQSEEFLQLKQQEAKFRKHEEAHRRKQEEYHIDWKEYLNQNLEKDIAALQENPGDFTNSLIYLYEQTRDKNGTRMRWADYNWKTLIPEFGEKVARFYRDSAVSFWRNHEPKLRSEGAPFNKIPYKVILGLTGLEIEAYETKEWSKKLNTSDVELACNYASFEMNGFPTWFPNLFETYPEIVGDFLIQEIKYELSIENSEKEIHYLLSDVSWTGQWAWEQIAPRIYELLKKEPKCLSTLNKLLTILQGSTLPDGLIAKLASRKCKTLKNIDHVAHWFAVWIGVAPKSAIPAFEFRSEQITDPDERSMFAMNFVTYLIGGYGNDRAIARSAFETSEHLESLYLLMHQYIQRKDDIDRSGSGVYSLELRDHAQRARESLLDLLYDLPGKESFLALSEIAKLHPDKASRQWIFVRAKSKAEKDADLESWSPKQVRDFYETLERTPSNHRELAELAILRLLDLKDDLEHGDSSVAGILQDVSQETRMRNFIGRELREKAFGRYSIPQEEELADAKRPDLRFHGVGFDGPVPIELKLAHNWPGPKLFERLENQLCGDYLRDNRSNRGILVLVYQGGKSRWEVPGLDSRVDFPGLVAALQGHWEHISPKYSNVNEIKVIGIDLTRRST